MPPRRRRAILGIVVSSLVALISRTRRATRPSVPRLPSLADLSPKKGDFRGPWYADPKYDPDPLTYIPVVRDREVKVLFMSSLRDSLTRVDTFLYELYDAAQRNRYVLPYLWGPGYQGYDGGDNLANNLDRHFGCGFFDIVFMHQGEPPIPDEFDSVRSLGCGTILATKVGDCNNNQCVWESTLLHGNITILRYAHEAFEMFSYSQLVAMKKRKYRNRPDMPFQLIAHVPDTANEWDYYPVDKWEDKTEDVVMFGKVDAAYYPIRITISEGIKYGLTFIKHHVAPPPFLMREADLQDLLDRRDIPTLQWNEPRHEPQRRVLKDFAKALRQTKICVFDGSIEEKAIRKFAQVMLSGCVVASDLVTEHDFELKDMIIELGLYDDIFDINRKIVKALANETELQRKASAALAWTRQHLSGLRELDLIIDLSERYRSGQRGYVLPFSFTSKCRRYHQFDDPDLQFVPPWCTGEEFATHEDWALPGEYTWSGPGFDRRGFILPEHQQELRGRGRSKGGGLL